MSNGKSFAVAEHGDSVLVRGEPAETFMAAEIPCKLFGRELNSLVKIIFVLACGYWSGNQESGPHGDFHERETSFRT